jgi:hypothetical protein
VACRAPTTRRRRLERYQAALQPTDEAANRWAEYQIQDSENALIRYAWMDRENEGTYVSVEITGSEAVERACETAIELMQAYRLLLDR